MRAGVTITMESQYETIRRLYMEKLSGVISEADEIRLAGLLQSDGAAQQIWQSFDEERLRIDVDDFLSGLEQEHELNQLKARITAKRTTRIRRLWRYAAVAAVIITGIFIFRYQEQTAPIEFPMIAATSDHVQLLTQDGQAVDLDGSGQGMVHALGPLEIRVVGTELQSVHSREVVMSTLVVPPKRSYQVTLPDGTKVWLNSASELHFPSRFDDSVREVSLKGEGYFDVAKNEQKPFIVHAGGTVVEVLGTRFNVSSYREEPIRTALVEGSVKVSAKNEPPIFLHPGLMSEFDGNRFQQATFDTVEATAWIDGVYYFNNASLDELAPVINRWYGLSVKLADGRLTRHRISGLLERDHLAYFLSDLHTSTDISYRIEEDTLIFY